MKIVVVVSRIPYPLEKGDKLRAYYQIKQLAANHQVFLFCLTDAGINTDAINHLRAFCSEVHVYKLRKWKIIIRLLVGLFNQLPFQVNYFFDRVISKKIRRKISGISPDRVYCQLIRMSEYVKDLHGIDKTIDYMDAFSKGMERRIENASFFMKPFVRAEYKRLLVYENRMFDYFEKKVIISKQDRDLIPHKDKHLITVIPNGVDTEYFQPHQTSKPQFDLLFHGNLSYAPNIECVQYIVEEIIPALEENGKNYSVLISGAAPSSKVRRLCQNHKQITLAGYVDDVRTSYSNARVLVAPFTSGTGLQNKLLEGMAMGIPCVTSALCFNALENAGKNEHLLVGASTHEYARLIIQLMEDNNLHTSLSQNGRNYVKHHYTWLKANERLEELIVQ
ncbi:MAG: glycosyltransferase [Flavobacteriales bacterium]